MERRNFGNGLDKGKAALSAKAGRRPNYHGEEMVAHNEATAQRLLDEGLARLRWNQARLEYEPKGHPEKVALAAAIRLQTTVSLAWLASRLHMGTAGHVSFRTRRHMITKHK